jgi:hypothetical protein
VLFAGLAAAIAAMNFLFNFKFEWDTFSILFTWIVGIFSTLFFLGGVPANFESLEADVSYPKGLKVFTQYVLIPLATVYVVILLSYEIKILVQWELPKGLVSNLILGYAVFGFLSLLLVYPIREQEENKWLKTYTRSFYFLLIPLLALLFAAAGTRVFRYGITEMRYFLIMLAIWLLFITLYFLFAKKQSIKLIPISLSVLILLSVYGPQSAFSAAMSSQQRVLTGLFKKYKAFNSGKLMAVDSSKINRNDASRAVSTLDYLVYRHGLSSLQPYFETDLDKVGDSLAVEKTARNIVVNVADYELRWRKLEWLKKQLGLSKFSQYDYQDATYLDTAESYTTYRFKIKNTEAIITTGFDFIASENKNYDDTVSYAIKADSFKQAVSNGTYSLSINKQSAYFSVEKRLKELAKANPKGKVVFDADDGIATHVLADSLLTWSQKTKGYTVVFTIKQVNFNFRRSEFAIQYLDANYLIKKD